MPTWTTEGPVVGGVTVFEHANFGGRSRTFSLVSEPRLITPDGLNDAISSIRVPVGFIAILYERADEGGGYGRSVDLLEDCADLSQYGFNDISSYVTVWSTSRPPQPGFVWRRAHLEGGQFVGGHWERRIANQPPEPETAVVSPPIPSQLSNRHTSMQVDGAQTIIAPLGAQTAADAARWAGATADQISVIGNDFRGVEEIGSAAFERASNNPFLPDFVNFWYPQKQPREQRTPVYFKRTLVGKVEDVSIAHHTGTYKDQDVDIYITPNEKYRYLVSDGHPREYTDIMRAQWEAKKKGLTETGQPSCDDSESIADYNLVEAEILPSSDIQDGTAQILNDRIEARGRQDIGVYGPWIYDRAHCCHAEIHPAEQIWWRDDISSNERRYTFGVFCDASKRFWWRDQMDDGTKLKPWGAPPIKGLFAIAFEAEIGKPALKFEVANIYHWNVADVPNGNQVYNLSYKSKNLVTFIPNNDAFKVTFENVGVPPESIGKDGPTKVRGFLVIETSVGLLTQKVTQVKYSPLGAPATTPPTVYNFPPGTDVNAVPQFLERQVFDKQEGRYLFTVSQTTFSAEAHVGLQSDWRWCNKCQGLFYGPAVATSRCPAGGAHASPAQSGSGNYSLPHGAEDPSRQSEWRWCNKCQGLFYGPGVATSRCPAGDAHSTPAQSGSANYSLPHGAGDPSRQSDWRWCNKCQGLFYGPAVGTSKCPAGGAHASPAQSGSGNYSLLMGPR